MSAASRNVGRGRMQAEPQVEVQAEARLEAGDAHTKRASAKRAGTKRTDVKHADARYAQKKQAGAKRATAASKPPQAQQTEQSPAVWRRLAAAVRGGISELGEVIAESQALRILDQEIRDNDAELHRVRASLAETLARYKVALDKHAAAASKQEEYEGYALKALRSGEDALARELAAKIALLEIERDGEAKRVREFGDGAANLRKVAAQFETTIKRLKQQVDTVRATESVQRAQAAVASRRSESDARVRTALDSLERIKRRQAERGAHLDAAAAADEADEDAALQVKLRRAGIIAEQAGGDTVLARLKDRLKEQK